MLRSRSVQYIISGSRSCKLSPSTSQPADALCIEGTAGGRGFSNSTGNAHKGAAPAPGQKPDAPLKTYPGGSTSAPGPPSVTSTPPPPRSSKLLPTFLVVGGLAGAAYYAYQEYPEQTKAGLSSLGIDPSRLPDRLPALPTLPTIPNVFGVQQTKKTTTPTSPTDGWQFEQAPETTAEVTPAGSSQEGAVATDSVEEAGPVRLDAAPLDQLLTEALTFTSLATVDQAVEDSNSLQQNEAEAQPAHPSPEATESPQEAAAAAAGATAGATQAAESVTHPSPSAARQVPVPQPEVITPLPKMVPRHGMHGVHIDLTPGGLVKYAVEHGEGPGEDWKAYDAQLRQAKSDAVAIAEGLQQAAEHTQQAIQQERSASAHWQRKAEEMRATSAEVVERMKDIIRLQGQHHALLLQDAVRGAKLEAMATAVESITKERVQRMGRLDAVRLQANALGQTVEAAGHAAQAAGRANRTALSLMRLDASLQQGRPFSRELAAVSRAAGDDPVVALAAGALANEGLQGGVPTREQLALTLARLRAPLGELATLPATGGGILARLAAKLTNSLKADEGQVVAAVGLTAAESSPDAALAAAEQLLEAGKLAEAADALEAGMRGTAAEGEVAGWLEAARKRVAVDVTGQLLKAHAAAVASSMVV